MASVVVVMSEEERDRFRRRARGDAVVIRHPVEHMPTQDTPPVNDPRVLSVLGFVHRRKGPELLIQAAARLDTPSRVALLGALADPSFENDLAATAAGAAMSDRVEITGFLPSDVLVDRILGTDVAVCAYVDIAASSSLATWLASRVPVVAYASRYVVELDAIAPGAIAVFHTYSADALAAALGSVLGEGPAERRDRRSAMDRLAEALAPPVIGAAYAELYRKVSSERRRWRSITGANASGG